MLVEGCVRGCGGECPSPPTWGTCVPLLVLAFVSCLFCWVVSGGARAGSSLVPLARLQLAALQKSTAWIFNQLFARCLGVKTVKVWSTGHLGRAQGGDEGARVCSIPRATSRRCHLGQALARGLPRDTEPQGFGAGVVVPWWPCWRSLGHGCRDSLDQSGIALSSLSVAL